MTVQETLRYGYTVLKNRGVETPFLDATLLLGESLSLTKEQILSSYPDQISESEFSRFEQFLEERINGYPISYIRKKKEFYSLEFYVDNRVFIPRPDTEILVDMAKEIIKHNTWVKKAHDVCTGSGCVAITLKHEFPPLSISASDLSGHAEEVFHLNSMMNLGWILPFYRTDLLAGIQQKFDLIVSNPPYLTENETKEMKKTNWPEPVMALNGGHDGLDTCRRLINQSMKALNDNGFLIVEAAFDQMDRLRDMMASAGYANVQVSRDLAGHERVIAGQKKQKLLL